jgi:hypothetical protein
MARDDAIALIGAILLIVGITLQFGPGWALMAAGLILIYTGMRLEIKRDEPD